MRRLPACLLLLLAVASPALADRVRIIDTDLEAAETRAALVLEAKEEILVSAFIFGDDPFTLTSLALLRDAARRGVRVQVLADAQWNHIPPAVQAHLLDVGVSIREYHPFRLRKLGWTLRRMHDKLVVADGRIMLAGGRNVESPYFGFGRQLERRNYIDCDLEVEGTSAAEARDYFLRLWKSREVRLAKPRATRLEMALASQELDRRKAWLDARIAEARQDPSRRPPERLEVGPVRFIHDPIGRKGIDPGVGHALRDLMDAARESVIIESPYLIPSRAFEKSLRATLERGVKVRILTNALSATDNIWAQGGYVGHKRELVAAGLELWEYTGPECLHTKAAVMDGETVVVGSFNLDPRSENLNTELALVSTHRGLAAELLQIMDEHLARSVRIDARGYPEGADEPFPGISRTKIFRLYLARLVAPLIRSQL